jgi:hypothetical protein
VSGGLVDAACGGPAKFARRGPRSHLIALQAHEAAPVALVGPAVRPRPRELREPLLIAQLGAARALAGVSR